ncbi:hypothetical protein NEIPOLOT_02164 [Neisseria polysaccharea ATCC 43768]|nr:hypothetical protein NEIPOLOT_02164 [Neisseria polysaccharea ATCC 43768]
MWMTEFARVQAYGFLCTAMPSETPGEDAAAAGFFHGGKDKLHIFCTSPYRKPPVSAACRFHPCRRRRCRASFLRMSVVGICRF